MAGQPYTKQRQLGATRKRYRRIVASRKTWERLRDERLAACLVCRHAGFRQIGDSELHHVVPRDRFGDDIAENLVSLCREHHRLVEAADTVTLRLLAEEIQQSEPAVYAYAVDKLGEDGWLRLHRIMFREAS